MIEKKLDSEFRFKFQFFVMKLKPWPRLSMNYENGLSLRKNPQCRKHLSWLRYWSSFYEKNCHVEKERRGAQKTPRGDEFRDLTVVETTRMKLSLLFTRKEDPQFWQDSLSNHLREMRMQKRRVDRYEVAFARLNRGESQVCKAGK